MPDEIYSVNARLLVIVNPNAPSGTLTDIDALDRIIKSFNGVVLIDEAYVDFAPYSALPLVKKHANLILLRSMSKGYGLAGMRFGYGIAQRVLLDQLYKIRDSYPCDAIAIAAATAAIEDQAYARQTWAKVIDQRCWLREALGQMGFSGPESFSNFVLSAAPTGFSAADLYTRLKADGVLVRYFNLPGLQDKLRITVGKPAENEALIRALGRIIPGPGITSQRNA